MGESEEIINGNFAVVNISVKIINEKDVEIFIKEKLLKNKLIYYTMGMPNKKDTDYIESKIADEILKATLGKHPKRVIFIREE